MQAYVKVTICGARVRTIQLQASKLPSSLTDRVWSLKALADALKFYPGVQFRRWVWEHRVYTMWLPMSRMPEKLLELVWARRV